MVLFWVVIIAVIVLVVRLLGNDAAARGAIRRRSRYSKNAMRAAISVKTNLSKRSVISKFSQHDHGTGISATGQIHHQGVAQAIEAEFEYRYARIGRSKKGFR